MSRFLPDSPQDIPGEEWRKRRRSRKPAENIPQLFVILRFHVVHPIQPFAGLEVALERKRKLSSYSRRLEETLKLSNARGMPHFA